MNSRFYIKISPKFRFNKISLNKQTGFNSDKNIKNLMYHFDGKNIIKRYNSEAKQNKKNDNQTEKVFYQYKKELNQIINNKYTDNLTSISNDKRLADISAIRSKLLQNNNKLQKIDFNVNPELDKDRELKLSINHYSSQRKINNKISRNKGSQNRMGNYLSEYVKNSYDISLNNRMNNLKTNNSQTFKKPNQLYLPYIPTNIIRKSNNMRSLIKMIDFNNYNGNERNEVDKQVRTIYNGKKTERDIFKNINYSIDNKKSQLKVNDIQRSRNNINNNDDLENFIFNKRKSSLINDKINKNDIEKNEEEDMNNKDLRKINEGDRYMIYENTKKFIDTDKIYNQRKFGLANIPNVSLDKGVKKVKNFETNVINMKNSQLDLPICIKLTKQ